MTTSGRWSWHCFTPSRCMSTALFPFRRQPYSYTSDGGTAHSSYPKIGMSSISRCWPINRRRRNMDSRSKTTWSPILIPCLSFTIVFTGELSFAWNPAGSDLRKSVTISAPSAKASDTLTTAGATCPFTMLYRTSLSISKGWEHLPSSSLMGRRSSVSTFRLLIPSSLCGFSLELFAWSGE